MSELVGTPEDRFSRVAAHILRGIFMSDLHTKSKHKFSKVEAYLRCD